MSAREHASGLLQQWLEMTRAEAEAIQSAAWQKLEEIQSRKASLRQPLAEAFQQWKPGEIPFRAELGRLIALESRNAQVLTDRLQKTRAEQLALERASQNLRNVRRSYAPPPATAWNTYS